MTTYDIHFQPVPVADVTGYRIFTFGYEAALKVSGPQALVNRWLKTFFTPKGSDILNPNAGTDLSGMLGNNFSGDTVDLQAMAGMAISDANEQVQEQDLLGNYPEEECLKNAELVNYSIEADAVYLWIQLTNQAGQKLTVGVPASIPE